MFELCLKLQSLEELAGLVSLIRSEPMTPEQLEALRAALAAQTAKSDEVKASLATQT